jgi:hypothetical protein
MIMAGTLTTTNISPQLPLVNRGLRAIAATYTQGTGDNVGTFTAVMTNNFLYGIVFDNVQIADTTIESIEMPLQAGEGNRKRFIEGEETGGNITLNFTPDAANYLQYPIPSVPTQDGLAFDTHFVLWIGFLLSSDPTKLVPYIEAPVNLANKEGLDWQKNNKATSSIQFVQSGEGLLIGKSVINKQLSYVAPT